VNRLYFGDNLAWLRNTKEFPDASVDLVYLDPPFNSNADYNVLFREASGQASQAQFHAFTDTWSWADAAETYHQFIDTCPNVAVVELMEALHSFLKHSPMMAYVAMMAPRLVELHRVLKSTGSLYLHCDPTASHYLRILLDEIFGAERFQNEIVWKRTTAHNDPKRFGRIGDRLLFYSKAAGKTFNRTIGQYSEEQLSRYKYEDHAGRFRAENLTAPHFSETRTVEWRGTHPGANRQWRFSIEELDRLYAAGRILLQRNGTPRKDGLKEYLHEAEGPPLQDIWTDIGLGPTAAERLGYQTQKPLALLDRIIIASSNRGDVVLDPFCGCGTTIHAAQRLDRQWVGIDVTYLAINLIKRRLRDAFGEEIDFEEKGQPTDYESAKQLAELDKFQFQQWALSLIGARPLKDGKGADRGVDGLVYFYETERKDIPGRIKEEPFKTEPVHREKIIVQVKGGGVNRSDVATLFGDVNNQKAASGVLITLERPSKQMREEASDAGRYRSKLWHDREYPRLQILTIEGLLNGTERIDAPPQLNPFAIATRESIRDTQKELL
jgi:site-specific DNA-methyltransferase (adenine-specific)